MPLMEHLRELRNRVIKIAIAVTAGSVIGWFVYNPVWDFIRAPYCKIPQPRGFGTLVLHQSCQLYVTGLWDPLFLRLQISIAIGIILSSPVWLYQLWAFIAPGLYKRERRWAYYFVGAAIPLFAIGATIAYFAMTKGLRFLLHLVPADTTALITINTYLSYAGAMLLIFGLAFELPLVFVLLNMAGVLTHERFRKWRRVIIFLRVRVRGHLHARARTRSACCCSRCRAWCSWRRRRSSPGRTTGAGPGTAACGSPA